MRISIHAPTRGATGGKDIIGGASEISIHAPTRGATDECRAWKEKHNAFQSTLPRGERPNCFDHCQGEMDISIHAPTRGATVFSFLLKDAEKDFNPRSHEGSDMIAPYDWQLLQVFQSTLPRGERQRRFLKFPSEQGFQSTLPRGERQSYIPTKKRVDDFNPRSHEGSDAGVATSVSSAVDFNPRSHEGSDHRLIGA